MTRAIIKTLGVALVATLPMLASAQLTGNVSLTTNYKFRGQDQDATKAKAVKPALQGGFDYAFGESGWYVGNWNSSVDWLTNNSLESDLYGGYKFKAAGADFDVGALTYIYPGNSNGNTTELYFTARTAAPAPPLHAASLLARREPAPRIPHRAPSASTPANRWLRIPAGTAGPGPGGIPPRRTAGCGAT